MPGASKENTMVAGRAETSGVHKSVTPQESKAESQGTAKLKNLTEIEKLGGKNRCSGQFLRSPPPRSPKNFAGV